MRMAPPFGPSICRLWQPSRIRRGVTLIEMLISVTLTLLIVFAVVQIFQFLGDTVAIGRATIEMSGQLRTVTNRLQQDLDNVTCAVKPWTDSEGGAGYFMYAEGPLRDNSYLRDVDTDGVFDQTDGTLVLPTFLGDQDDVLAFTIRSSGKPFKGFNGGAVIESQVAEVVWWLATMPDGSRALLRRVFLILPSAIPVVDPNKRHKFT